MKKLLAIITLIILTSCGEDSSQTSGDTSNNPGPNNNPVQEKCPGINEALIITHVLNGDLTKSIQAKATTDTLNDLSEKIKSKVLSTLKDCN